MQGKILLVDAIVTNRILLKVKLQSAFYEVLQASTLSEALAQVRAERPDLVISALDLPDGSAGRLCRALHRRYGEDALPVMAVGAGASPADRRAALEAGVRDLLGHPLDEVLLLGRVRSLIRGHLAQDEWQLREETGQTFGLAEGEAAFAHRPRCLMAGEDPARLQQCAVQLRPALSMDLALTPQAELMRRLQQGPCPDVFLLHLPDGARAGEACLGLISALRANAKVRHAGILVLQARRDSALAARALDMGADDLVTEGFEARELSLRLEALVRRSRRAERLRSTVRTGLQAAVFDPLTGLHNRRYAMPHLDRIAAQAERTGRCFAVLAADLDHFKEVNDRYGHASGDAVLVEVAQRLRACLGARDMAARIGGEEFLVVMPGTTQAKARAAAQRICETISRGDFEIPGSPRPISVTISIGMAVSGPPEGPPPRRGTRKVGAALLARADRALYAAKGGGRNQVTLSRPAA